MSENGDKKLHDTESFVKSKRKEAMANRNRDTILGIQTKANEMFLVGWATDGFPIYYKWGYKYAKDLIVN